MSVDDSFVVGAIGVGANESTSVGAVVFTGRRGRMKKRQEEFVEIRLTPGY